MFPGFAVGHQAGQWSDRQGGLQVRYLNEPSLTVGLLPRSRNKFIDFIPKLLVKNHESVILPTA